MLDERSKIAHIFLFDFDQEKCDLNSFVLWVYLFEHQPFFCTIPPTCSKQL